MYFEKLKKLATKCNFGTLKDSLLNDKLISGVRYPKLMDSLLREENINLPKFVDMCKIAQLN